MTESITGVWDGQAVENASGALGAIAALAEYAEGHRIQAIMGWDGYFVLDEDVDPVDMARAYMEVVQRESCGKCVPCSMGTRVAADVLTRIADGKGRIEDLDTLRAVGELVREGSLCELGHSSMVAVLALLDRYEDEFVRAIHEGVRRPRGTYHTKVTAPCIEACPERLDIPRYIEYIRAGRYVDSLTVIHEKNPLASVCGRVCVRFCEFACRRGKLDDPVDIKHLKRFVSDVEMDAAVKEYRPEAIARPDAPTVAIVGAGPAGMTAAYHLLRKGFRVEIFEANLEPGGMAALGIPDYRLPRQVLRTELEVIQQMGAEIHYGRAMGRDFALQDLRERYAAVFLAIGAQRGSNLRIEGEDERPAGYMPGVAFLRSVNLDEPIEFGRRVVVVGGGNVAMDCARCAVRLGADEVHLVYRRTRQDMPADHEEVEGAEEEGVIYHFLANPSRLIIEEGRITGVECVEMGMGEPDASGAAAPCPSRAASSSSLRRGDPGHRPAGGYLLPGRWRGTGAQQVAHHRGGSRHAVHQPAGRVLRRRLRLRPRHAHRGDGRRVPRQPLDRPVPARGARHPFRRRADVAHLPAPRRARRGRRGPPGPRRAAHGNARAPGGGARRRFRGDRDRALP